MNRPDFNQPPELWLVDGSLRDVYIQDVTASDWKSLLDQALESTHEYSRDGEVRNIPEAAAILEDKGHSHLLCIQIGQVKIHCHFFNAAEIELDLEPRDVASSNDHLALLQFLENLGAAMQKSVLISDEGNREHAYLRYEPLQGMWHVYQNSFRSDA